jgi:hypothetical protein
MQKLVDGVLVEMTNEEIERFMRVDVPPIEPAPTKEQLLAELQALTAKIQALE